MKKVFIGLLILAAGAGVFFLLRKKKNETAITINKELIVGKWKAVAEQPAKDSAQPIYQYEFQQPGAVIRSLSDSAITDTSYYEWSRKNELVWKQNASDTAGTIYTVVLLTKDSLQLQSKDSATTSFIKSR